MHSNLKKTVLNLLSFCSYFVYEKINLDKFTINKKSCTQKYEFIVCGSDEIWNFNNEQLVLMISILENTIF